MLNHAIMKLKQLIYDDSGIAMAYTVLVFLFFFLLCASVAAMTENIRQKMELQNACDAAVYSGAVVQADMLSRIAVLNRALSWTYFQTSRRHMDYIVNDWIKNTVNTWNFYRPLVPPMHLDTGGCGGHGQSPNYWSQALYGWFIGWNNKERVQLNRINEVPINTLKNNTSLPPGCTAELISSGNKNIKILSDEISEIKYQINAFIASAVTRTMNQNLGTDEYSYWVDGKWNDTSSRKASYLKSENSEINFLAYSDNVQSGDGIQKGFGKGWNTWWRLSESNDGIYRYYEETSTALLARFRYWATTWERADTEGAVCHYALTHVSFTTPDIRPTCENQFKMERARPQKLDSSFFGKAGSIVVAAKRRLANPFSWMDDLTEGLYAAFTPEGNNDMWAVSAARAGIRLKNKQGTPGHYEVQYPGDTVSGYTNGVWNLCEEDWDGVLIPVSRAWNETEPGKWDDDDITSEEILKEVKDKLNIQSKYESGIGEMLKH